MANLHAVVVGCNYDGANHALPVLKEAESDAAGMSRVLQATPFLNGDSSAVKTLLGREATLDAVRLALEEAITQLMRARHDGGQTKTQEANEDDTLFFYFSGHGSRDHRGLTLYTWDATLSASELLSILDAYPRRSAVVLDCCHAGAIESSEPVASDIGE